MSYPTRGKVGVLFAEDFFFIEYKAPEYKFPFRQMGWTDKGFATRLWTPSGWQVWQPAAAVLHKTDAAYDGIILRAEEIDMPPTIRWSNDTTTQETTP